MVIEAMGFRGTSRFEIIDKLGEGGMGIVYEAFDHQRSMYVALKTLRRLDPAGLYRFKREFRALSDLSHPNVIQLYELMAEDGDWFFTMELVRGGNLIEFLRASAASVPNDPTMQVTNPQRSNLGADDDTATTMNIGDVSSPALIRSSTTVTPTHVEDLVDLRVLRATMLQLAGALHALHGAGLVHRDLKPSNIRVTEAGHVVLMDFGIVAQSGAPEAPGNSPLIGTPYFMAPEQIAGAPATAAADWYAFGVILHLALSGQLPFRGSRRHVLEAKQRSDPPLVDTLVPGVPSGLSRLVSALLSRRPEERPSGAEILHALGKSGGTDPAVAADTFVGRRAELEVMRLCFDKVCRGDPGTMCVFVEGESGMGKSALVRRFTRDLGDSPVVLSGRCHQRESVPFKGFDGVIDSLTSVLTSLPERRARDMLPPDVELLSRIFPVLRAVPGVAPPGKPVDPQLERARAVEALRVLLSRLAARRPLVLVIDDLQWADADSIGLLLDLCREPAPAPMLFIATVRTEEVSARSAVASAMDEIAARHQGRQLALAPLPEAEQHELVVNTLGETTPLGVLSGSMWKEASGNPLLLVELARHARESSDDERESGPIGLDDLVRNRIAQLDPRSLALLEIVALAEEAISLEAAGEAAGVPSEELERAAASLRAANLARLSHPGGRPHLVIYHDRARQLSVERIPPETLATSHGHIARALDAREGASHAALARHWDAAGNRKRALRHLIAGGDAAVAQLAFDHAVDLYRRAVELAPDHRDLLEQLGDALALAGRSYEAAEAFERAAAGADSERRLDLERKAADNLLRSGHIERGLERAGGVVRELGAPFAPTRRRAAMSLVWQRARIKLRGLQYNARSPDECDPADARRLDTMYAAGSSLGMIDHIRGAAVHAYHLLDALEVGDEHRICRALAIECAYLVAPGGASARRGRALRDRVVAMASELGDPYLIAVAQLTHGGASLLSGEPLAAQAPLVECVELLSRVPVSGQWERVTAQYFLARAQIDAGDFRSASETTSDVLREAERNRDIYARAMFQSIPLTWDLLCQDRSDAIAPMLDQALQGWPTGSYYIAHYVQAYSRGLTQLYQGSAAAALETIRVMMPRIRQLFLTRMPWVMGEIQILRGRAGVVAGDKSSVRSATRYLDNGECEYHRGVADTLRAAMFRRRGDDDEAAARLREACTHFELAGVAHLEAAARQRLGAITADSEQLRQGMRYFESQPVRNIEAFVELLCPGLGVR